MEYSHETHVRVTKGGHEEWLAKTTWENTIPDKDGSRGGYFLMPTTPPEVLEFQQIKEVKSLKDLKAGETIIDPALTAKVEVVEPVTKAAEVVTKEEVKEVKAKPGKKGK